MSTAEWAFLLVVVILVIAAAVCGVAWKVAFEDGHEAGALSERNLRNEGRLRQRRTDRAAGEIWGTDPDVGGYDEWLRSLTGGNERLADTGELRQLEHKPAGTATGSFRTLLATKADAFILRIQAEEAAYRKGIAS